MRTNRVSARGNDLSKLNPFAARSRAKRGARPWGRAAAVLAAAVAGVAGLRAPARADNLQWDNNGDFTNGIQNGSGTWDLSNTNWFNGTNSVAWVNGNVAIFGGDPFLTGTNASGIGGIVTLGTNLTVSGITFNAPGYLIGSTSALGTGNNLFTLNLNAGTVINANSDAELSTALAGTSFTKTGAGTLYLYGTRGFGAAGQSITLSAGRLAITDDADLGVAGETLLFDGGRLVIGSQGNISRSISATTNGGTIEVASGRTSYYSGSNFSAGGNTLTKDGLGTFQIVTSQTNFAGSILLATGGGRLSVVGAGAFGTGLTNLTVNPGASLLVDNLNAANIFAANSNTTRLAVTTGITLNGGSFTYQGGNGTAALREIFGTVTANLGESAILAISGGTGGPGGELEMKNLVINPNATVNFIPSSVIGAVGNFGRVFIDSLNGGAAPATGQLLGGWAVVNNLDFAGYNGTVGVVAYTNTAGTNGFPVYATNLASGAVTLISNTTVLGAGTVVTGALKLAGAGGTNITMTNGTTLYLESGGYISDNNAHTIGTAATNGGQITAGGTSNTGQPVSLYTFINGNTTTLNAQIVDNPGNGTAGILTLVKGGGGTLTLTATNNFGGGVIVNQGTLDTGAQANSHYFGSGTVLVNAAQLNLRISNATTSTNGISVINLGELAVQGGGINFSGTGDHFTINSGSQIFFSANGASETSLARVTFFDGTAGGQVILAPDAQVVFGASAAGANGVAGTNAPRNLGTAADLYFGVGGTLNTAGQQVTIGTGTPWKGMSTDRAASRIWQQGTIFANSDFYLQGDLVPIASGSNPTSTYNTLTLGAPTAALSILNNSAAVNGGTTIPIFANTLGNVTLATIAPTISSSITFSVSPGSTLALTNNNAFGSSTTDVTLNASAIIRDGGILDLNGSASAAINGNVTFESGSRLVANDTGTNNFAGIGAMNFLKGSIIDVTVSNGLLGTQAFNTSQGAILRIEVDGPAGISTRVSPNSTFEIFGGNRALATATSSAGIENFILSGGGILTNDNSSRNVNASQGLFFIGTGGGTIAASIGSTFTVIPPVNIGTNVLQIGINDSIAGNPKSGVSTLGAYTLGGGASFSNNVNLVGILGVGLNVNNLTQPTIHFTDDVNIPASGAVQLVQAVTQTIGRLTGSGSVLASAAGTLQVGNGNVDSTFAGSFSGAAGTQTPLTKIGTGTLNLTGVSTSTGVMSANQGTINLTGGGVVAFGTDVLNRSGAITVDDSSVNVGNRLGGTAKTVVFAGGSLNLIGSPTGSVLENIGTFRLDNTSGGVGGQSYLNITPGAGGSTILLASTATTSVVGPMTVLVVRGPNLGAAPGAGVATFAALTPNLVGNGSTTDGSSHALPGGTYNLSIRPDILGDTDPNGTGQGFVTQDNTTNGFRLLTSGEYAQALLANVSGGINNLQLQNNVSGNFIADTQVNSLTFSGSGGSLGFNGTGVARFKVFSGGIFVAAGATGSISSTYLDINSDAAYITTQGTLTLNGQLVNGTGLVKSGTGTLNVGQSFFKSIGGNVTITDGVMNLGPDNLILNTLTGAAPGPRSLFLAGGQLNLNGNNESLNTLQSNPLPGQGGVISNASGSNVTLTLFGSSTFGGTITGQIDLVKTSANTITLTAVNDFTGAVTLKGGTLTLRDSAALPNATSLTSNFSTLLVDNTNSLTDVDGRISLATPITLRGGTIQVNGGINNPNTSASFGTITADLGQNIIDARATDGGTNTINVVNLVRTGSNLGTIIDFRGNGAGIQLGLLASNSVSVMPRIFVTSINGSAPTTSGPIGAWAITGDGDYAAYNGTTGIGPMGGVGYPAYATTPASGVFANVNNGSYTVPTGGTSVGALRLQGTNGVLFGAATDVLNVETGGILGDNQNTARSIGSTSTAGILTAGGANSGPVELFFHVNQNTLTVNSTIADNGSGGQVSVVKTLGGSVTLAQTNSASGTFYADAGTLNLGAAAANNSTAFTVPGNLMVQGGTVTETVKNQFAPTSNVSYYGAGTVNVNAASNESIRSISFDNVNGGQNFAIANGGVVVLNSIATPITFNNDNLGSTPQITGSGLLDFGGTVTTRNIFVSGASPVGGQITAGIQNAALAKTGPGLLILGSTNSTFTGGLDVLAGTVRVDTALGLSTAANTTTVEPNTLLLANFTGTIAGAIKLNGGQLATTSTTPNYTGPVTVAADTTVLQYRFDQPANSGNMTISGVLGGTNALRIQGSMDDASTNTFLLSNTNNTYTGTITVVGYNGNTRLQSASSGSNGSTIKNVPVVLDGGRLLIRDDGQTAGVNGSTNTLLSYGNNLTVQSTATAPILLAAQSFIDLDHVTAAGSNNTVAFNNLNINDAYLATSQTDGYVVSFTGNVTLGGATVGGINNASTFNIAQPLKAANSSIVLQKAGAGTLNLGTSSAGVFDASFGGVVQTYQGNVNFQTNPGRGNLIMQGGQFTQTPGTIQISSLTVNPYFLAASGAPTTFATLQAAKGINFGSSGTGTITVNPGTNSIAVLVVPSNMTFTNLASFNNNGVVIGTGVGTIKASVFTGSGVYAPQTAGASVTLNGTVADPVGGGQTTLGVIWGSGTSASQVIVPNPMQQTGGIAVGTGGVLHVTASGAGALGSGAMKVLPTGQLLLDPGANNAISPGTATTTILNDGLLTAHSGTVNFGTRFINSQNQTAGTSYSNGLSARFFSAATVGLANFQTAATADPFITAESGTNFLNFPTSTTTGFVTNGPLSVDVNTLRAFEGGAVTNGVDTGMAITGTLTVGGSSALPAGPVTFGTATDDGSTLYVDLNKDGVFTANERVISNLGAHGIQQLTYTENLAAGSYKFAYMYYQGGGGGLSEARIGAGQNVAYTNLTVINPSNPVLAGAFSGTTFAGSSIQVDSSATLAAGGFNAGAVLLNGGTTGATSAILALADNASLVHSVASSMTVANANSFATMSLGANDTYSVDDVTLAAGSTLVLAQGLGGAGSVTINHSHTIPTGAAINVNGVTAFFNGTGSGGGSVTAGTGGVIAGTGSITGPVTLSSGSKLAPGGGNTLAVGNDTGRLAVDSVSMADGSTFAVDINGTTAGAVSNGYDQLRVANAISLGSTSDGSGNTNAILAVTASQHYADTGHLGDTFLILQGTSTSLANATVFSGLPDGSTFFDTSGNVQFQVNYGDFDTGGQSNDVKLTVTSIVPEPSMIGLAAFGAVGLLARRRKRHKL